MCVACDRFCVLVLVEWSKTGWNACMYIDSVLVSRRCEYACLSLHVMCVVLGSI